MARIRSNGNVLKNTLDAAPRPVYVVDEQRRIVYCNAALEELVGVERAQLVGLGCTYQMPTSGSSPSEVASSLCPPPTACGGQPVERCGHVVAFVRSCHQTACNVHAARD